MMQGPRVSKIPILAQKSKYFELQECKTYLLRSQAVELPVSFKWTSYWTRALCKCHIEVYSEVSSSSGIRKRRKKKAFQVPR